MPAEPADLERLLAHADWLRALARRLVGASEADDVVQETLVAAMQSPPDAERAPRPWLARVMVNVTRMRFRSASRRERREDAVAGVAAPAASPSQIVERLELQRTLTELVMELAEPYRRTVVMHYLDGMSLAEIARADGVAEGTVRWRHKQALERMRAALDQRSRGDRKAWVAALAPMVAPRIAGGLIVKKVVAVIAVAIALLVGWKVVTRGSEAPPPQAAAAMPRAPSSHVRFGHQLPVAGDERGTIRGAVIGGDAATDVSLFAMGDIPELVARQTGARFAFTARAGVYCVVARSAELTGSACDLELRGRDEVERDVELVRGDAKLVGTVGDADGGPIGEALVVVQRMLARDTVAAIRTDAAGRYAVALAPGWYRVTGHAEGYTTALHVIEVAAEVRLDLHLNAGATVAGRVVDEGGRGVANATVTMLIGRRSTRTAASASDGRFAITGLRPGNFEILASAGERVAQVQPITVVFGATSELELVVADTRGAIDGTLVDDAGRPIAGGTVELGGQSARIARTDLAGAFRFAGLAAGSYEVGASADGFVRTSTQQLVGDGPAKLELRASRGVTVTGRVVTSAGAPVAGARVASSAANLRDPRLDARTDERGAFTLGPLPPGAVQLSAFHPAHGVSEIATVEVPRGSAPTAELVFRAAGSITGKVLDDAGQPAAGALVTITPDAAPANWTLAADRDGAFKLDSLPAGKYRVEAAPPTGDSVQARAHLQATSYVELAAGDAKAIELRVPGGSESIRGTAIDATSKQPIAGAAIWVEREGGYLLTPALLDDVRTYSWTDGRFALSSVARGTYTVYASHPERGTGKLAGVAAGARDIAVPLAAGASFSGRALGTDGKPLTTFQVVWQVIDRTSNMGQTMSRHTRMVRATDGRFRIDHVAPTPTAIVSIVTPDGATGDAEPFALAAGEHKGDLAITVRGIGTVRGRIVDAATGKPALGFTVFFPAAGIFARGQPVDGDGRFEARVPANDYSHLNIQTETNGYPDVERPFTVSPGQTTDLGDVRVQLKR